MEAIRKSIFNPGLSLVICFSILITQLLSPISVHAQAASSSSQLSPTNYPLPANYTSPQSPHSASLAIYNFSHAVSCILIGQSPTGPCLEYKLYQDAQGAIRSTPYLSNVNISNGILGATLSMITTVVSTKPVSSSEFIADLGEQIGVSSAQAQVGGSGNKTLSSIFKLWEVSRNIAYLGMILIFLFVGLMVMFRQKLNPQTVVSIQLALPGLVIGLIMITFSYFLAALISDVAFLGTNVVGYYFALAQGESALTQPPLINAAGGEENVITIFSRHLGLVDTGPVHDVIRSVWDSLPPGASAFLTMASGLMVGQFTNNISQLAQIIPRWGQGIQVGVNLVVGTAGGLAGAWTTALMITWIAWAVLLYSMIRLLLRLISSLLTIIFLTISAPFFFLAASIPGRQGIATSWMFNMLCNVLVFPAVVAVFYFVIFITGRTDPAFATSGVATTLTGNAIFPLLGGIDLKVLNMLIGFGALAALPSIPDAICKSIGKPSQLGGIIGGAVSGNIAAGQRYYNQATQGAYQLAGRAHQLHDKPGYFGQEETDPATGRSRVTWTRTLDPRGGAQPGIIGKIQANIRGGHEDLPH